MKAPETVAAATSCFLAGIVVVLALWGNMWTGNQSMPQITSQATSTLYQAPTLPAGLAEMLTSNAASADTDDKLGFVGQVYTS